MITDMRNQSRRCTVHECNKLLAQEDPHNKCRNCRSPCDVDNRCPDCIQLSAVQVLSINQTYTKMAARRVRQAKWARRNRLQKNKSSDEMSQRLRALESVLLLQSTQGTSLETLLLAEGIPLPARTLNRADDQQPSTSTGTYTRQGPLQIKPRDDQVYTPTGSIGEVDGSSGDDTTYWIDRNVNSQIEVINSRQDDTTSQRRPDDVDSQRRHKEVNSDDLHRRVEVNIKEINVDDLRRRVDVNSQHKRVSVDDQHKKVNIDDLHRRVDDDSQEVDVDNRLRRIEIDNQEVNLDDVRRRTDVDRQEVKVDDRRRRSDGDSHHKEVNVDNKLKRVNVDDQHRRFDVNSQHKQVNVDDRHRRYDVDSQHKDIIDDRRRRDDVDRQRKEVNVDRDTNVDDRRERVDSRQKLVNTGKSTQASTRLRDDSRSPLRHRRDRSTDRHHHRDDRHRSRSRVRRSRSTSPRRSSTRDYRRRSYDRSPRRQSSTYNQRELSEERFYSSDTERDDGDEDRGFLNSIEIIEKIYQLFPDLPFPPEEVSSKPKSAADSVITGHSKQVSKKALPMAELIGGIKDQLDKTFAEHHGVAPVIRAQQWATNFRVFNTNFKDRAPIFDDDLGTIAARSSSSTVLVQDKY